MQYLTWIRCVRLAGVALAPFVLLSGLLAQPVTLDANGPGNTYELISNTFGGTSYEVPDCGHASFGRHITEEWDDELQAYVFVFHIHAVPDNDRCINFDRQRNEIKTYDQSPAKLLATEGETHVYRWKFRVDSAFQPSPNFTHVFQIKPKGGNDDSLPIITITLRYGNPEQVQIRFAPSNGGQSTVANTDLSSLKGQWLEGVCRALYRNNGKIELRLTTQDGDTVLSYSDYLIDMWRQGAIFNRPKWGIYRSLDSPSYLRDEQMRFANFSIEEPPPSAVPDAPFGLTLNQPNTYQINLGWTDSSNNETNFLIQRSLDGATWTDLAIVDADVTAYTDIFLPPNLTFYYRVRAENWESNSAFSNVDSATTGVTGINPDLPEGLPTAIELHQNYPNPFNPATAIRYTVGATNPFSAYAVKLEIFDLRGQRVRTLVAGEQPAGNYTVNWDGRNTSGAAAASGVYLYRLTAGGVVQTQKMFLLR